MRVFLCGHELGLGFVIARRLVKQGHTLNVLTSFPNLIPNLTKNGLSPILGKITDDGPQRLLAKADAVIDTEFPSTFPKKRVRIEQLRPSLLKRAFDFSGRVLIVTSHAAVLGDTGPIPATEEATPHPMRGFGWALRLEEEMSHRSKSRVLIIRPAWRIHGRGQSLGIEVLNNWIPLSWRFKRGTYIGPGRNCFSAVHLEDLAELYCLVLERARNARVIHAASENISTKEVAASIHRAMRFKGDPKSISLDEARRLTPIADGLTKSHAVSSDYAKAKLGWTPSRDSMLRAIEDESAVYAMSKRRKVPAPTG